MTDVPRTSPERPIIWSRGRPATGSRTRPVDVPIQNFRIFVFPVKNSNRCVKQELLHRKNTFFINLSIFCWSPKSPLPVKNSNRCVKQELLHLKKTFFINLSIFCWSPKSPLKVPWRFRTLGPLRDVSGTSRAGKVVVYL